METVISCLNGVKVMIVCAKVSQWPLGSQVCDYEGLGCGCEPGERDWSKAVAVLVGRGGIWILGYFGVGVS